MVACTAARFGDTVAGLMEVMQHWSNILNREDCGPHTGRFNCKEQLSTLNKGFPTHELKTDHSFHLSATPFHCVAL